MALFETVVAGLETGAKWITVQFQGLGRYGGAEAKAVSAENPKLLLVVAAPFKYHPSIHYYLYLAKGEGAMLTCDILMQELEVGLVVTAPFNLNTTLPSTTSYIT